MIRENNQAGGFTHTWVYNSAGNITERKEYAYTTGDLTDITPTDTVNYTYGNTNWGDLLTAYDGQALTYDEIGNLLNDGEWTYTWKHGRQLATASRNGITWNYTYDANGLRTKKDCGVLTYTYVYDGSQLAEMSFYTDLFKFTYDAGGTPLTVDYNGTIYYYVTNLQGDVITILNTSKQPVVQYTYDAWGKVLSVTGSMASTLGLRNPLRYRGYVYDQETYLYCLQSRYYDPEWGRFINADAYAATGQGFVGNNMFAYCGNNSVCRNDIAGTFWEDAISGILHTANDFAISVGIDTAAIGAFFLMMEQDDSGVYHARFDCWQQYAGYNQLYDYAFDMGTSMVAVQFGFSYNGCGYTIWAWKGDYINLGAGAELGIYRGASGHRTVDTSLAMWMNLVVIYNNEKIIEYFPDGDQWWITGFNPKYQNVNANDLSVVVWMQFNNSGMYYAFQNQWLGDPRCCFVDDLQFAFIVF